MKNNLEIYPFMRRNKHETEIDPIMSRRLSDDNEQERLMKEMYR